MSRAIVLGGSIAGMSAARVLGDFYDQVVILDRDQFPTEVGFRSGVPQSRHAHALLGRGQNELEGLFPGFVGEMLEAGAQMFDPGTGFAMRRGPGWQDVGKNGADALWSSRELLEHTVRSLLLKQGKVELRQGVQALGLRATPVTPAQPRQVNGVRIRPTGGSEQVLEAELIVDATGRHSHAEQWLKELGIATPATQRVDARNAYASRFYKPPALRDRPAHWWWKGLWVEAQPGNLRGAVIFPIEGDRWLVTATGMNGDYPPTDDAGFVGFLELLSSPAIAEAVKLATPLSDISGNRSMANVFRRYDQQKAPPRGFVAMGDAVCAFNPIYGQGMSAATACAVILRHALATRDFGRTLEQQFYAEQAEFLTGVWNLATGADFQWPHTEGERPAMPAGVARYLGLALESAHCDAKLRQHIAPIFNLTGPMTLLFDPVFVAKVLAASGARRLRQRLQGSTPIPALPPAPV